ncbi:MAG: TadE/TadG family type IV pilus assembly protein [Burkholderiaceae bacterium]
MRGWRERSLRVAANEAGSPAVEFALGAPVLLLVMTAIVEFGMIMFVTVLMEGGLREAARYGITGQTPADGTRAAQIMAIVADRTLGLVDIGKAAISITAYPTFDDVGNGEDFIDGNKNEKYDSGETYKDCNGNNKRDEDRGKSDAGSAGDVVVYRFEYDWPLLTSLMGPIIGKDGKFHVEANAIMRNEPWDGSALGKERANCNL